MYYPDNFLEEVYVSQKSKASGQLTKSGSIEEAKPFESQTKEAKAVYIKETST